MSALRDYIDNLEQEIIKKALDPEAEGEYKRLYGEYLALIAEYYSLFDTRLGEGIE